jgi:hypothetical protein
MDLGDFLTNASGHPAAVAAVKRFLCESVRASPPLLLNQVKATLRTNKAKQQVAVVLLRLGLRSLSTVRHKRRQATGAMDCDLMSCFKWVAAFLLGLVILFRIFRCGQRAFKAGESRSHLFTLITQALEGRTQDPRIQYGLWKAMSYLHMYKCFPKKKLTHRIMNALMHCSSHEVHIYVLKRSLDSFFFRLFYLATFTNSC